MFETGSVLRTEELATWAGRLAVLDVDVDDSTRVRQLGVLESVKAAAAAAQARVAVDFDASQRAAQRAAGVPAGRVGAGIGEQVALARRESPTHGSRHLGLARALVTEMPHTLAALTEGRISEWRATLVTRATAVLGREDRAAVDAALAGRLDALSDRAVDAAARAAAYEADPDAFVKQGRRAVADRRVTIRPALDLMANVTGFLPVAQGVAVWGALHKYALARRAGGDERSLDQIRADTLVERVTGQASADAVPVEIELIITDTALFPHRDPAPDTPAEHDAAAASAQPRRDPEATGGEVVPFAGDTGAPHPGDGEPSCTDSAQLIHDGDAGLQPASERHDIHDSPAKHDVASAAAQPRRGPEATPGGGVVAFPGDTGAPHPGDGETSCTDSDQLIHDGDAGLQPASEGHDVHDGDAGPEGDLVADGVDAGCQPVSEGHDIDDIPGVQAGPHSDLVVDDGAAGADGGPLADGEPTGPEGDVVADGADGHGDAVSSAADGRPVTVGDNPPEGAATAGSDAEPGWVLDLDAWPGAAAGSKPGAAPPRGCVLGGDGDGPITGAGASRAGEAIGDPAASADQTAGDGVPGTPNDQAASGLPHPIRSQPGPDGPHGAEPERPASREGGRAGADRSAGRCESDPAESDPAASAASTASADADRTNGDARCTDRGPARGQQATSQPVADPDDTWRTRQEPTPVVDLTSRARPTPRPPDPDPGAASAGAVAYLSGLGPIPAGIARDLLANASDGGARLWMRRVFTDPGTGAITAMDTHRRRFPDWMRHLVRLRDQWCRTPWCGAPIRHIDHVTGHARGGPTSLSNAQGLCERCNHAKETAAWSAGPDPHPDDPTRARTSTPTGHTHHSTAPPALGVPPPQPEATSRSA